MEVQGIDPCTSRMLNARSTMWATPPDDRFFILYNQNKNVELTWYIFLKFALFFVKLILVLGTWKAMIQCIAFLTCLQNANKDTRKLFLPPKVDLCQKKNVNFFFFLMERITTRILKTIEDKNPLPTTWSRKTDVRRGYVGTFQLWFSKTGVSCLGWAPTFNRKRG